MDPLPTIYYPMPLAAYECITLEISRNMTLPFDFFSQTKRLVDQMIAIFIEDLSIGLVGLTGQISQALGQ